MATAVEPGYDATGSNIGHLPAGKVVCGYSTGSDGIAWTTAQFKAHPGAVWIDQDPGAEDSTADVLDVENGAATIADCPGWVRRALASWTAVKRAGQRKPAIYCNQSNVTPVVNELIAAGIVSGVGLFPANWNYTYQEAAAIVAEAGGPFPIIGLQYNNAGLIDDDVFSVPWLSNISRPPAPAVTKPVTDPVGKPTVAPPGIWTFPVPAGLRAFSISSTGYRLAWGPVAGPQGQKAVNYQVVTYDAEGKVAGSQTVPNLGTSEYGRGGHGLPKGTYTTHVWADGAPSAPPHAMVTVTLKD
jgi:hypothetical protein